MRTTSEVSPANLTQTIAAIATATGGGIGIIRISGPRAEAVLRALCPSLPRTLPTHKLVLTRARADGVDLDEVLAVVMRAPRSYTGDDVAELHAHGGAANLQRLLDAVLANGTRLATPGEFTRRAFTAGKLDLVQVEAVQAVIGARDERTLRAAHALRSGSLGRQVEVARRTVVTELAEIEGALDFPDEAEESLKTLDVRAARLRACAASLLSRASVYRRPLGVVPEVLLIGAVNAGKSSLLNSLCGYERALVDSAPGTTRDVVEADVDLGPGIGLVRVVDTAGLRAEAEVTPLERRGQGIARQRRLGAAVTLLVYDGSSGFGTENEALRASLVGSGPVLLVENKCDLPGTRVRSDVLRVSARTGEGLDTLRDAVAAMLGEGDEEVVLASARQAAALRLAADAIASAAEALDGTLAAPEVAAVELRRGLGALGQLTGESVDEEVLDALFSRFCIGK